MSCFSDLQIDRQTDRYIDRQTDRQTGRQTDRPTDRQTNIGRQRLIDIDLRYIDRQR